MRFKSNEFPFGKKHKAEQPRYSVKDVAEAIGVTPNHIYLLIKQGKCPPLDSDGVISKKGKATGTWKKSTIQPFIDSRNKSNGQ